MRKDRIGEVVRLVERLYGMVVIKAMRIAAQEGPLDHIEQGHLVPDHAAAAIT